MKNSTMIRLTSLAMVACLAGPAFASNTTGATKGKATAKPAATQAPAVPAPEPNVPGYDAVVAEVERMSDLYRAVTNYHLLLQGDGVTSNTVRSALYDVERYLDEIDTKYATDQLFIKDQKALADITKTVAKAHFQGAILHARGVDLEASITQYEKTLDLLKMDPADWEQELERTARPGLLPQAQEIAFQMTTPRAAVEDLKTFWASGVVTRFKTRDLSPTQRATIKIERIGGRNDGFSEAAFQVAAARFTTRVADGLDEFRVVLPPGRYRVSAGDPTFPAFEMQLAEGGVPDPIYVNPNTFAFSWASDNEKCRPTLVLNGLAMKTFSALPYGTYHVQRQPGCEQRLPDKIVVDQNTEVTLRTEPPKLDFVREGQPIFLFITTPPASTYTLRF